MNPVVHFEMPAEDTKRMADFYTHVFGWKMQMTGPEMGNYVVVQTDETDDKGMLKKTNRINGGFFPKEGSPAKHSMLVIGVEDIQAHMEKVKAAGGKILNEVVDIPGIGKYVSFEDTEGNRVNMLQPMNPM